MSEERIGWNKLTSLNLSTHRQNIEEKESKNVGGRGWNTLANLHQNAKLSNRDEEINDKFERIKSPGLPLAPGMNPIFMLAKGVENSVKQTISVLPVNESQDNDDIEIAKIERPRVLETRGIGRIKSDYRASHRMLAAKRQELRRYMRSSLEARQKSLDLTTTERSLMHKRKQTMPIVRKQSKEKTLMLCKKAAAGRALKQLREGVLPGNYKIHCRYIEIENIMPATREGGVLVSMGYKMYLIGGQSGNITNSVDVFHRASMKWTKWVGTGQFVARTGHTANKYGANSIVIFGGMNNYDHKSKLRSCLNSINILDLHNGTVKYEKPSGETVGPRRHHAAVVVEQHLVVYGGLNERNGFLDDLQIYDLQENEWKVGKATGRGPKAIAYHTMTAIYPVEYKKVKNFSLFNCPEMLFSMKPNERLLKFGIFLFGGMKANGSVNPHLYLLQTGSLGFQWKKMSTNGVPPSPRFLHTANYSEILNVLIIYGGRSAEKQTPLNCYNDINMLNMDTLTWSKVDARGVSGPPRSSHCAGIIDTMLFVFGGANSSQYINSQLMVHELDNDAARSLIMEDDTFAEARKRRDSMLRRRNEMLEASGTTSNRHSSMVQESTTDLPGRSGSIPRHDTNHLPVVSQSMTSSPTPKYTRQRVVKFGNK